ncbi:MAG: manganese-binding transcriptional regulator MntR [Alphaproteobacteria bacterium]|nr:manganese-binding transcriptional regulator MntR [Alphaproteobacteria bacterium]
MKKIETLTASGSGEPLKSRRKVPLDLDRAAAFEYVRQAHQEETAQDYVEMIADLIAQHGEARVVDLAKNMGVSHATINKTIARLNRDGLVVNRPYRAIFLTPEGESMARDCKARHDIVFRFLCALGVKPATAHLDAEGVEHHISPETLKAFERFLKKHKC